MAYAPPSPFAIASDSSLSEDYIFTDDILVSQTSIAPLGVFQDSAGNTEALVITDNNILLHVFVDSSSPSGWNATQVSPDGTSVAEVVAGLHSDNVVYGFFTDSSGNLFCISLAQGGTWSSPAAMNVQVNGLRVTYCGRSLVAYGSDRSESQQAIVNTGSGYFATMVPSEVPMAVPGPGVPQPALLFTGSDFTSDVLMLAQDLAPPSGPTVPQLLVLPYQNVGTSEAPAYQYNLDEVGDLKTLISPPALTVWTSFLGPGYFLILDAVGNFSLGEYNVEEAESSIVAQLATGGNQQASVLIDSSGLAHLFTVDSSQTLSVIHQTASDLSSGGSFAPPIPLLTDVARAAVPPNVQQVTTLFTVAYSDGTLFYHRQSPMTDDPNDPSSGAWTSIRVQQPGQSTGYHVSQYLTEVLVLDANGSPVPGAQVSITSDTPSAIAVGGTTTPVSSSQAVSCIADATGTIRIATIAGAVGTAPLTISSPDLPAQKIWPDGPVENYLQGLSGLNEMPLLTPDTLIQSGLCPAIPASNPNSQAIAQQALTNISLTYQAGRAFTAPAPSPAESSAANVADRVVGFHLDWSDLSNPTLTLFHSEEEFQAHRAALYGSIFSDVSHFFGDIYHGLKHAALSVEQWTVHLATSTVDFVTKELGALTGIVIRSVDDVVSVVHSVFTALGAAVSDVIDFLKALFSWEDIWNTKEVIEHWMNEGFSFLEDLLGQYAETAVSSFFTKLEGDIATEFSKLQSALGNPTAGSNASKSPVPQASGSSSSPAPSARGNWMMDKMKADSSKGLPPLTLTPGSALETALNNLKITFTNPPGDADWYSSLGQTFNDTGGALIKLASDPSKIPTLGVSDLIQILQDLITTAVKAADWLVSLLLDLLNALVAAADDILNTPLTALPFVSYLYSEVIAPNHEALSLQHAMALMAAVPVTLLYKVAHGGSAPFTSVQVTQIQSQTFNPSAQTAAAGALVRDGSPSPLIGDFLTIVLGVETLSYSTVDLASQAAALKLPGADTFARLAALFNSTLAWTAQVLSWPGTPFTRIRFSSSSTNEGETILDALWVANWVPPAVSLGWVGVTWVNAAFSEVLGATEKVEDIGNSLVSVIGVIREYMAMVGSIWQAVANPSASTIESGLENVIAQLPDSLELLRLSAVVDATDGISVPAKIILNALCNMSVAGLQAVQTL